MKKVISYLLLFALIFNVFVTNVFAADSAITATITQDKDSSGNWDNNGNVNIQITSNANSDLIVKITDKNNKVVYLKSLLGNENDGDETLVIKKQDLGFETFTLTVSDGVKGIEKELKVEYYSKPGPGPGPGPGPNPQPVPPPWTPDEPTPDNPNNPDNPNPGIEPNPGPAPKDPLNGEVIKAAAGVTTPSGASSFIDKATKATDPGAMAWESTRNTIAVSAETMMANIGSKKISTSSSTNKLVLKESSVSDSDLKKYTDAEKTINDAMNKNKITLNRELSKEYIVNTTFSTAKKANITIHKGYVTKLEKVGIETLTINDKNFRVSYSMSELKEMIGEKEFTSFDIDTTAMSSKTKKLAVTFDTDKTQSVKISFPGLSSDAKYMAIVDENGNPVGGRYNPATGAIEAKITESGVYQIVNNEKDFEDIKHLSDEMQESIKILAAKGIIEGTSAKEFSPEDSISRAEVAALLLRVLSQVDPNADGGFADVKKSDWFYGTAGSAKAYGMILGFEDNTFRGNVTIAKDQILAIASRVLQREMKYITPDKPEEWLTFADASSIADWAANDIALTTMANIVTRTADNTIHADEDMTRGDAALIIMRLFYKIW